MNSTSKKIDFNQIDILECIANLSNDEVFTPPPIANRMLDLLPAELWQNPNAKFLDPFTKSGVFLREIAKRLIVGLETQIPDLQERLDHIFGHQLYGIGITDLTAQMSRRTLYCSKDASHPKYAQATCFDHPDGNIFFEEVSHTFEKGKCIYCGINDKELNEENREGKNTYAYPFIHNILGLMEKHPQHATFYKLLKEMKFDVIIGNPPYQMSDGGGTGDSAKPIYHLFIEQAMKLEPNYLCMIVPSRWMKGGKGLDKFREKMINDTRIRFIYDFENAKEVFPGIDLDGGVCYFLWDKKHNAEVDYYYKPKDGNEIHSERFLKTEISDTVIRDYRQISIIEKISKKGEERFSNIVSSRRPFGFGADFFNEPDRYKEIKVEKESSTNLCKIYGVKGKKGGAKRIFGYIDKKHISTNVLSIDKYKLYFSKAYMTTATVPPEIIIGEPNTICTETFLKIGDFGSDNFAINCLSYIKTKFFRALLFFNRHSLNISQDSFNLIPLQDFTQPWTDEELYKKYNLSQEEIDYIENLIDEMP